MSLNNSILIALALNSTPEQIEEAHAAIDRFFGGVDPASLVDTTSTPDATIASTTDTASTTSQLDAAGLPWDERIHSSSKDKNKDGTWRARRGVDAGLKVKVEAELRATVGAAAPAPAPAPTPAAPALPGANLPPMPGAAAVDPKYTALVKFIASNTQSEANPTGRLTDDYIKQVLTHYGVAEGSLQNLAHRLDLVDEVQAWLTQVLSS